MDQKDIFIVFAIIISTFAVILFIIEWTNWRENAALKEAILEIVRAHSIAMNDCTAAWAAERQDLMDRLMARDLTEVKMAQNIGTGSRKVISRAQNTQRIINENIKIGGTD